MLFRYIAAHLSLTLQKLKYNAACSLPWKHRCCRVYRKVLKSLEKKTCWNWNISQAVLYKSIQKPGRIHHETLFVWSLCIFKVPKGSDCLLVNLVNLTWFTSTVTRKTPFTTGTRSFPAGSLPALGHFGLSFRRWITNLGSKGHQKKNTGHLAANSKRCVSNMTERVCNGFKCKFCRPDSSIPTEVSCNGRRMLPKLTNTNQ